MANRVGDDRLAEELIDALAWDARLAGCHVDVHVEQGIAVLSGYVEMQSQKLIASDIASRIKGVRDVVDKLVIRPSEIRTDEELAADIDISLGQDIRVDRRGIVISVTGGFATLSGEVSSPEEGRAAVEDVWSIKGINGVTNNMRVLSPEARTEEAIESQVLAFVGSGGRILDPTRISVRCRAGVVYLRGGVSSPGERRLLEEYARSIEGVEAVRNELAVEPAGNE